MSRRLLFVAGLIAAIFAAVTVTARPAAQTVARGAAAPTAATYFPDRFEWTHRAPQDVGMNAALVADAVQQAVASETAGSRPWSSFSRTASAVSRTMSASVPPAFAVPPPASSSTAA